MLKATWSSDDLTDREVEKRLVVRLPSAIAFPFLLLAGCMTFPERVQRHESPIASVNESELFAKLPSSLSEDEAMQQEVHVVRPELTGNPRHGKWTLVQRGRAVVVGVDKDMLRMRLLSGKAEKGDRIVCCYGRIESIEKTRSRLNSGRAKDGIKGAKTSGSLKDSVLPD